MSNKLFRNYKSYSGSSSQTYDVFNDLGREGSALTIRNKGASDMTINIKSERNALFGEDIVLEKNEILRGSGLEVYGLKITATDNFKIVIF